MKMKILYSIFFLFYAELSFAEAVSRELPEELQSLLSLARTAEAVCSGNQETFDKCLGIGPSECTSMMTTILEYCAESTTGFPESINDPEVYSSYEQCIDVQYLQYLQDHGHDPEAICPP